jgi:prolyl-tRNA synthetase
VVIPIYRGEDEKHAILDHCQSLAQELKSRGLRAHADLDEQSTPGAKFNTWELKGVPLRVHVGPRDLQKEVVELARRDTRSKIKDVARAGVGDTISELLTEIQTNLFQRHMDWQSQHTRDISSLSDLDAMLAEGGGLGLMHWDGTEASERALKEHNKATIRVVPFEGETLEGSCAVSGQPVTGPRVYVGRAY